MSYRGPQVNLECIYSVRQEQNEDRLRRVDAL